MDLSLKGENVRAQSLHVQLLHVDQQPVVKPARIVHGTWYVLLDLADVPPLEGAELAGKELLMLLEDLVLQVPFRPHHVLQELLVELGILLCKADRGRLLIHFAQCVEVRSRRVRHLLTRVLRLLPHSLMQVLNEQVEALSVGDGANELKVLGHLLLDGAEVLAEVEDARRVALASRVLLHRE